MLPAAPPLSTRPDSTSGQIAPAQPTPRSDETSGFEELPLRGVAWRVGIAAPSIYLRFADVEHLAVAATEQTPVEICLVLSRVRTPLTGWRLRSSQTMGWLPAETR
jgi:hypothetical protein